MVPTELFTDRHTPNKRRLIVAGAVVVALAAAGALYARTTTPAAPKYDTVRVERGPIAARVTATGTLSALQTVEVGAQVTGRIKELLVDFNSPVKKGQLLARLDAQSFDEAVAQARANVAAAAASLERAQSDEKQTALQEKREQQLVDHGLAAQADLDAAQAAAEQARASVAGAKSAVAQAKAGLDRAQTDRSYTEIHAPIDGVVLSRAVDVGQTVAASLAAPTLFTIAGDLSRMQVEVSVSEADIGTVKEGQHAAFTVDAYPGRKFDGVVRQVRSAPVTVQNVVTYTVIVDVDNADLLLKPGMTANVSFTVAEAQDALRLPNAALRYRPATPAGAPGKGGKVVTVLRGGAPLQVRVQLGITDGSATEVKSGDLREGDLIVTGAGDDGATPAKPAAAASPFGGGARRGGPRGGAR